MSLIPNFILLRRDPRLIALSYFERNTVPERTFYGLEFLLSPEYRDTLPLPGLAPHDRLSADLLVRT
jgi:hypothetical protein